MRPRQCSPIRYSAGEWLVARSANSRSAFSDDTTQRDLTAWQNAVNPLRTDTPKITRPSYTPS